MENNIWIECERIGNVIANEFRNKYPEAIIRTGVEDLINEVGVKQFVFLFAIEGAELTLTVQHRLHADKPFVYMDSIKVNENYRGKGLSTGILDTLAGLVNKKVFKYLNLKDWSAGYWHYIKGRYPFIKDKYDEGFHYG